MTRKTAPKKTAPADSSKPTGSRRSRSRRKSKKHRPHKSGGERNKIKKWYLDSRRLLRYLGKPPQVSVKNGQPDPPHDVLKLLARVTGTTVPHARKVFNNESSLHLEVFTKLDDDQGTSGHYFRKRKPYEVHYTDARLAFAERLETLILQGIIPMECPDPDTGEPVPVDVVRYSWHIRDGILANIPISHNHQRDAFRLLVDWDLLVEKKSDVYAQGLKPTIGRMEMIRPSLPMLLHEIDVREAIELKAIDLLERENHLVDFAQQLYPERFESYCKISRWDNQDEVTEDKEFLKEVPVKEVVDLDLDVRRVLISTGGSEASVRSLYRESRYAIVEKQRMMKRKAETTEFQDQFPAWWRILYFENKRDLVKLGQALGKPGEKAEFDKLRQIVRENNEKTREMLTENDTNAGIVGSCGDVV